MLEQLFQELNVQHFNQGLPLPKLFWNPRLSSAAGRFRAGSRNPLRPRPAEIEIAAYLKDIPDGITHIRDTLLHEMVHYLLWHQQKPFGHTPEFHRILKRVGARRYNTVPKVRPAKYHYRCPHCQVVFPTRRRLKGSACAPCCKKFSGGYYSERFRLELTTAPVAPPKTMLRAAPPAREEKEIEGRPMAPNEIIRRLEELKRMVLRR